MISMSIVIACSWMIVLGILVSIFMTIKNLIKMTKTVKKEDNRIWIKFHILAIVALVIIFILIAFFMGIMTKSIITG